MSLMQMRSWFSMLWFGKYILELIFLICVKLYLCVHMLYFNYRWATSQCSNTGLEATPVNKRKIAEKLLPLIRFPIMKPEDFIAEVALKNKGFLTEQELLQVFMYFSAGIDTRCVNQLVSLTSSFAMQCQKSLDTFSFELRIMSSNFVNRIARKRKCPVTFGAAPWIWLSRSYC